MLAILQRNTTQVRSAEGDFAKCQRKSLRICERDPLFDVSLHRLGDNDSISFPPVRPGPGGVENGEQKVNDTFSILPPPRHLDRREKEGRRDLIAVVGCEVIDSHPLLLVQPTLVSGGGKKGRKRRRRRIRGLMMMILLPSWERPPLLI